MRKSLSCISAGLLFLVLITGVVLASVKVSADVIDNIDITVPASCSLSTNSGTGETYSVSMMPGQYKNDIGDTTISVFCNTNDTYALYAIGYSNDTLGTTDMISNNTATTGDISTGTAVNGSSSAWAMKLTPITGTYAPTIDNGFSNFSSVPSTYTKVASVSSAITPSTDIASVKATYAVYISPTQKVATYTGKVKYTIVNPNNAPAPDGPQAATSGCINYFPSGNNVVGTMGCQSISASDTSATLLASNFSRSGYGFAGWNDKYDYTGTFYGPQEDITFTAGQYTGSNNGLALYAVWVPSAGSLQDSSKVSQLCGTGTGSLTTAPTDGTADLSSVSALTDQRDGETYAIAKLADGKCWMIENLRLEAENTRGATNQALAQGYGTSATYGNFGGLADAESTGFATTYSANSLYSNDGSNDTINIGTSYAAYRMPRYNNWNNQSISSNRPQDPITNRDTNSTTNAGIYSYGNYYTWHAAIADLTYNGANNSSVTTTSLCPSGWHLPTGGLAYASGNTGGVNVTGDTSTFREFYNLGYKIMDEIKTAYEDTPNDGFAIYSSNTTNTTGNTALKAFRSFPNNFLYSGYFTASFAGSRGGDGYYWSSTTQVGYRGCSLALLSSRMNVYPGSNYEIKSYGLSVRCTASVD